MYVVPTVPRPSTQKFNSDLNEANRESKRIQKKKKKLRAL